MYLAKLIEVGTFGSTQWQMQVLWHRACTLVVPCLWKEVWRVWQGQPLQGSLQVITDMTG